MPVASIAPSDSLPASEFLFILARGSRMRTLRMGVGTLWGLAGAAALVVVWLVASTLYLAFHDDLVAALIAREAATQYAYEDRIAALRGQVEHEASLKLVGETTLEGRLKDLGTRATTLEARASLLTEVGARAGVATSLARRQGAGASASADAPPFDGDTTGSIVPQPPLPMAPDAPAKPHPESESSAADVLGNPAGGQPAFRIRLAAVEERLERVDAAQYRTLGLLRDAARDKAGALRSAMASAGLTPDRFVTQGASDEGGPFVPLDPAITRSAFGQAIEAMQADLATAGGLARALPHLPFATPLSGPLEVTSPFGPRIDPFLGRPGMHTGVDLREGYGTEVHATAAGRVVTAGPLGGYGTMVEIDHGHGLSTRYGHLESVEVAVGQVVAKGALIGEVGSTGRATGPHLHYETRIDGEAVDPVRFLNAGFRLAAQDIAP